MLARIKFTNSSSNKLNRKELDKLEGFLGEKVSSSQMKIDADGEITPKNWRDTFDKEKAEKDKDYTYVTPADMYQISEGNNYIVDLERFTSEFPNLEISIKGIPKAIGAEHNDLISEMNKIAEKIEDGKNRFDKVVEFNQRCDVHVPNLGLLNINRLAYATDYCTEELQRLLKQGWRIIAVCPQPDQRRPDYILGMHQSGLDDQVEVSHFDGNGNDREKELK